MKIRKGFISNSSSTSFICDVCGEEVSGMDMGLEEAEMYECENGHTFCRHESIGDSVVGEEDEEEILTERPLQDDAFDAYEIPAKHCPCCTFRAASPRDLIAYLLKKAGMNEEAVVGEMRTDFQSFEAFQDYIKEG